MKPKGCEACPYNIDAILARYRRVSFVRIGDKKIILELVSDADPTARRPIEDEDAAACLSRVPGGSK